MCGIVGYVGNKSAQPILIDALKRLEYRGYDSAGIAVIHDKIQLYKNKGTVEELTATLPKMLGKFGVAHTRWATHGLPTKENAHPFLDCKKKIAIVHNGIIENYSSLKEQLKKEGHLFTSETDTEVFVHLIEKFYNKSLEQAVRQAVRYLRGSYAFAVIHNDDKNKIVAVRNESPLIVGIGRGENFIASDVPAILPYTKKVVYLMDKEIAILEAGNIKITDFNGRAIRRKEEIIAWNIEDAEKSGYPHFMLKEIFEQPTAIHNSLLGRLQDLETNEFKTNEFDSIKIVACGTSYHAGLIGKYIFESLVRIPTSVELSSEYRYTQPSHGYPLVLAISQSGETADTLAAVREAHRRGCKTLAITNVVGSSITREIQNVFFTQAGPEIGVAATKTFTTQLIALYILALRFGISRNTIGYDELRRLQDVLRSMPRYAQNVLDNAPGIERIANKIYKARNIFFVGRNINYPTALEGALKLKEISYIHAEGYPAGELKHGPLALLTKDTPVIAIAIRDHTYDKLIGNIGEISARGSPVIAIGYENDTDLEKYVDDVIYIQEIYPLFSPVPISVVLQLLAYYVAKERGCSIDKPRNLAKSVTVE